jgi:hypothetical protein
MVTDNEMVRYIAVYSLLMYLTGFTSILYGRRTIPAAPTC